MKIVHIQQEQLPERIPIADSFAGDGYRQGPGGQLPDVDIDFQSDRRQEVKEYLERRYNTDGRQQVFSAGTLTTLKMKAVLKDVSRMHRVPVGVVNYITAIFGDDNMTGTDLFKLSASNKKVRDFILRYPRVIEDIRPLMGQPRSGSVHASAIIITPKQQDGEPMECFDYTPIKKVDDLLISELDGYSIDEVGLLKNDCLGIKELSKIQAVIDICNREYGAGLSFEGIVRSGLDDEKTFRILSEGYTQNVFQFSSPGMTRFLQDMRPQCIGDLIAAGALYRPATLDSGSAEKYLLCRREEVAPVYLWGTYDALKNTYGVLVFQEQLAQMAREVGGFSLAEGVRLAEIERRARDVGDLPGGDQHRVDRRGVAGVDGHDVVEDRAVTLALEVEEGVVREVHHGRLVGRGLVVDAELVFGRERVGHLDLQVARETFLSVGVEVLHHQTVFRGRNHVPDHAVQAFEPAVERLAVIVDRQAVLRAVEREAALGDAVGVGSHDRAEEAFAVIVDVAVDRLVAEHDVFVVARTVGGPERYDACAVVGDLHGHVARMERVDTDGLAVRLRLEGLVAKQGDFRLLASAGSQQQGA